MKIGFLQLDTITTDLEGRYEAEDIFLFLLLFLLARVTLNFLFQGLVLGAQSPCGNSDDEFWHTILNLKDLVVKLSLKPTPLAIPMT